MENSKDKYIFKCNIFKPTSNLTALLQSITLSKNGLMAPSGKPCKDGWNKQENKKEEKTREQFQRECIINTFKVCKEIEYTKEKEHSTKADLQDNLVWILNLKKFICWNTI